MGAGDLNVKKSWHPRLQKNQEKVWLHEQEAAAEHKKLEELRKEREQERQMQELQRIHEAAGGKRRPERVEWMYATPATSSGPSEAELEEYLLGKKRVDKLLQGNETARLSRTSDPSAQESSDVSSARDLAQKIREDPLFAIKKQEQAMQEMLMKDPTRLRQMRARLGLPDDEPRHNHHSHEERSRHRHRHERRSHHGRVSRSHARRDDGVGEREYSEGRHRRHREHSRRYDEGDRHKDDRYRDARNEDRHAHDHDRNKRHNDDHYRHRHAREDGRYPAHDRHSWQDERGRRPNWEERNERHSHDTLSRQRSRSPDDRRRVVDAQEREAKLAAMMQDAKTMDANRDAMIRRVSEQENREHQEEEMRRDLAHDKTQWRKGGGTGRASFLLDQQRNLWGESSGGMDLEERLRRNRHALQPVGDDG